MKVTSGLTRAVKNAAKGVLRHFPRLRLAVRKAYWAMRSASYNRLARRTETDAYLVFFEAYGGRSYACSPRALYEQMLRDPAYARYRFVWSFAAQSDPPDFAAIEAAESEGAPAASAPSPSAPSPSAPSPSASSPSTPSPSAPTRTKVVTRGSEEYFAALAAAGVIIQNNRLPEYVTPKPEQTYVQCWHGTPLKRLGFDMVETGGGALNTQSELAMRFAMDAEKWTYLISPSPYTSEHLASAFALAEERRARVIIEEGYPRNDVLARAYNHPDTQAAAKRALGISPDVRVLLYAPTWRDDSYKASTGYTFACPLDFTAMRQALGDGYVVLFRAHYLVANAFDFSAYEGFVIDASKVSDINDLYLAADALITDYSSVMFDFALTRRQLLLFAPDAAHYAEDLHGFYFSLDEVPGPLCTTTEEVIATVSDAEGYRRHYRQSYDAFLARFAPHDDGHASQRVLSRIFPRE